MLDGNEGNGWLCVRHALSKTNIPHGCETNRIIYPDMMTISELKITNLNQLDHDTSLFEGIILSFFAAPKRFALQILETSYPTFGFPDTTTLVKPKRCTLATKAWRHGICDQNESSDHPKQPGLQRILVPRVSASQNLYSNAIMVGKWWHTFALGGIERLKSNKKDSIFFVIFFLSLKSMFTWNPQNQNYDDPNFP